MSLFVTGASATEVKPIYPQSIEISCGKLEVRLGAASFWNMNRVLYDKLPVSVNLRGAYWGTVIQFPKIGFVGSGHKDHGKSEQVLGIRILADGKQLSTQEMAKLIKCSEFTMEKQSQIENIVFTYTLNIKNDLITEDCKMEALKPSKLTLMYNFMHPWSEKMTDYYIQIKPEKSKQGKFKTNNKFPYMGKFSWVALFNKANQTGVVSKFVKSDKAILVLWDRKQYKKTYLCSFRKKTMATSQKAHYKMVTAFFKSPADNWLKTAKTTADKL